MPSQADDVEFGLARNYSMLEYEMVTSVYDIPDQPNINLLLRKQHLDVYDAFGTAVHTWKARHPRCQLSAKVCDS